MVGRRLARSLRQAGQFALRVRPVIAWLSSVSTRFQGARKRRPVALPPSRARSGHPWLGQFERFAPQRLGSALTLSVLFAAVAFGVVRGDHVAEVATAFDDLRNAGANAVGFNITAVAVNGRKHLSQEEVLAIGKVTGRSSLLFLDAASVRDRLKANPWIVDATVLKLYPGRLQIDLIERKAFALWQKDGEVAVIAEDGKVLEPYATRRFTHLPLVVGNGAETRAKDFLALLNQYPQVRNVTRAIVYVGDRRWNLRFANGIDVRLPEHDVGRALAALTKLDREDRLFTRDIVAIDMRLSGRVAVRLSEAAAKARDDLLKDKKKKEKKATDA